MKRITMLALFAVCMVLAAFPAQARDGFIHSYEYIFSVNTNGFEGMSPEQIARYLGHFSAGAADGAARAMASHGKAALPLIKNLFKDTHPMVRRGAVTALMHMYKSDRPEYASELTPELADMLAAVRPLVSDPSPEVRGAVSALVTSLKVLNENIYEILYQMARNGNGDSALNRYVIKDPAVRVKIARLMTEHGLNKTDVVPGDFHLFLVTTAHLESCRGVVPLALNMVRSPKVWNLYGTNSHLPMRNALMILNQFAGADPRVLENLYAILYVSERKANRIENSYFFHMNTLPRAIVLNIGFPAVPVLERFLKDMNIRERAYDDRSDKDAATWWKETRKGAAHRMHDWQVTLELLHCLNGQRPAKNAAESVARIYIDRHYWQDTERVMIMEHLVKSDPSLVPAWKAAAADELRGLMVSWVQMKLDELRRKDPAPDPALLSVVEQELHGLPDSIGPCLDALVKAGANKGSIDWLRSSLKGAATRLEDLYTVGCVIQAAGEKPTAETVKTLATLLIRREWADDGPAGPLWIEPKRFARDTLVRWGTAVEPHLSAYVEGRAPETKARLDYLDERVKYWKKQPWKYAMRHLTRIPMEKEDTLDALERLKDIRHVIHCMNQKELSDDDTATLCRILTRRGWRSLDKEILAALKKGSRAVINKHIVTEGDEGLADVVSKKNQFISMTVRSRYRWSYELYKALESDIREGVALLK